ncbi:MAG: LPS assembly lipoprotein LptE [Puniceicoccales bacterium]|jgi:hypothetical protein|nr:LPS assembly lipoprotein LptE [Puniceicoccales bacterium]
MGVGRLILLVAAAILGGCRYQRGTGTAMRSIYVEPGSNGSLCPKAALTAQLAKAIQRSASLKLACKHEADAHLRVEIVNFLQKNSAYDPKDTSIVLSLNLCVVAECTLIDREGRFLLERQRVEVGMDLEKCNDFHLLRDQATPQLMERLAREICTLLVNIW